MVSGRYDYLALYALLDDGAQELETRLNFQLRSTCFHNGADNGNMDILGANVVSGRNHSYVDIWKNDKKRLKSGHRNLDPPFRRPTWF